MSFHVISCHYMSLHVSLDFSPLTFNKVGRGQGQICRPRPSATATRSGRRPTIGVGCSQILFFETFLPIWSKFTLPSVRVSHEVGGGRDSLAVVLSAVEDSGDESKRRAVHVAWPISHDKLLITKIEGRRPQVLDGHHLHLFHSVAAADSLGANLLLHVTRDETQPDYPVPT
jgi:hypothetical protein